MPPVLKTKARQDSPRVLVYLPYSYDGRGPAETCASLVTAFAASGLPVTVFMPRMTKRPFSRRVDAVETMWTPIRRVPFRLAARLARWSLDRAFTRALDRADPAKTIAYFWSDVSLPVLRHAKAKGIMTVREMINNPVVIANGLLDEAYARFGAVPTHGATSEKAAHEALELPLYDRLFSSNAEVDRNLMAVGIDPRKILMTTYGWRPERLAPQGVEPTEPRRGLRALFVGTVEIRKGVPELLNAWRDADVDGELLLAGSVSPELKPLIDAHVAGGKVRHLGFVEDVNTLYRSADVFVFPTHEEGGPQVTIEAGRCGLPIIATPMGAARFVEDGKNGIIVPPGDVPALTSAIRRLAASAEERWRMGEEARLRAPRHAYAEVGAQRARMLMTALQARASSSQAVHGA